MINTSQVSTLNWQVYLCKSSLLKGAMGIFHLTLPSIPISVKYQEFSYFKVDPLKIGTLVHEIILLQLPNSKRTSKFTDPGFQMRSPNPKNHSPKIAHLSTNHRIADFKVVLWLVKRWEIFGPMLFACGFLTWIFALIQESHTGIIVNDYKEYMVLLSNSLKIWVRNSLIKHDLLIPHNLE